MAGGTRVAGSPCAGQAQGQSIVSGTVRHIDTIPVCVAVTMSVLGGGGLVLSAVSVAGFLVPGVRLWLIQLIQCREYRLAVKVSTCNNLPPPI
jgi:hypothetical protein